MKLFSKFLGYGRGEGFALPRPWFTRPSPRGRSGRGRSVLRLETLEDRTLLSVAVAPVETEVQANLQANPAVDQRASLSTSPHVGVAADGSFDVVWTRAFSATDTDVYVQRFNRDGSVKGNAIAVAQSIQPENQAKIAVRADGTFAVVYQAPAPGGHRSVFAKVYDPNGNLLSGAGAVQLATTGYGARDQTNPDVDISDGANVFVASWTDDFSSNDSDVHARKFNFDGTPFSSDIGVATSTNPEFDSAIAHRPVAVSGDNTTACVVTYTQTSLQGSSVYAQRLDTNMGKLGPAIKVNDGPDHADESSVDIDAALNFVVTWRSGTANTAAIKIRRYDGNGTPATTAAETVDDATPGKKMNPAVAKADDGRFIVSYLVTGAATSRVYFQQFQPDGTPVAGKRFFTDHVGDQAPPALGASGNGYFAFAAEEFSGNKYTPWARTFHETSPTLFAVTGAGRVEVRTIAGNTKVADFQPYGAGYTGGVSTAFGDVNGDGVPDLIVGGINGPHNVLVYDGRALAAGNFQPNGSGLLFQWTPYDAAFNVGEYVAAGDVNRDGFADIVTGASIGNPNVRVWNGRDIAQNTFNPAGASKLRDFFPYQINFNVGTTVAAWDFNGDGYADVVTGALPGNPHVRVFDGKALTQGPFDFNEFNNANADQLANPGFFPFKINFDVGAYVAAGDVYGDGGDLIVGSSQGNPEVRVYRNADVRNPNFDPQSSAPANGFFANALGQNIGSTVGAGKFEGDSQPADILVGSVNGPAHWRVVKGTTNGGPNPPAAVANLEGDFTGASGSLFVGA